MSSLAIAIGLLGAQHHGGGGGASGGGAGGKKGGGGGKKGGGAGGKKGGGGGKKGGARGRPRITNLIKKWTPAETKWLERHLDKAAARNGFDTENGGVSWRE